MLGHTFVDGLDVSSKLNLDSACEGICIHKPYSEIQTLLNNFTANDHIWKSDGERGRIIKHRVAGALEQDKFTFMRANIAKLTNQVMKLAMGQAHQMHHVQHMATCCDIVDRVTRVTSA